MSPQAPPAPAGIDEIRRRIAAAASAAGRGDVRLLAVGKTRPAEAIAALAQTGQHAFGENYVQEAVAKRAALDRLGLEWHLIGPLQSNKCKPAAATFDWIQSIDRERLIEPLARFRAAATMVPLDVLIQVDIDDESSKSGCAPGDVDALAAAIAAHPSSLRLRGLMAIPQPHDDPERRRPAFRAMRRLFETLRMQHATVDTLSMGMSDDFELAIAEGATMVRIGTALFGERTVKA